MFTRLRDSLRGRGPIPKILLAGAAVSAAGLVGAGAANAATSSTTAGHPVTTLTSHSVVAKTSSANEAEPGSLTDNDNIQSGDQTGPDTKGGVDTKESTDQTDANERTSGPDTDNIQSGGQSGDQSGDQSGPETPDTGQHG